MEDNERSNNTVDIDSGEDFASLLAQYEQSHDPLKSGQVVEGKIVRIFDNEVLVDAGGRSEGILKKDEIVGPDGSLLFGVGDSIPLSSRRTVPSSRPLWRKPLPPVRTWRAKLLR